jgi:hypothetical protein
MHWSWVRVASVHGISCGKFIVSQRQVKDPVIGGVCPSCSTHKISLSASLLVVKRLRPGPENIVNYSMDIFRGKLSPMQWVAQLGDANLMLTSVVMGIKAVMFSLCTIGNMKPVPAQLPNTQAVSVPLSIGDAPFSCSMQ